MSKAFEKVKAEFLEREGHRKEKGLGVGVPYLMDEADTIAEFNRIFGIGHLALPTPQEDE